MERGTFACAATSRHFVIRAEGSGKTDRHEIRRMASKVTEAKKEQMQDMEGLHDE